MSGAADQIQISIDPASKFDFDQEVEGLRGHVARIKELSNAIDEERKQQGDLIQSLEEVLERASLGMKRAMRRLNIAYAQSKSNHMLYFVLFAMLLFFVVYILGKLYRMGRSIF